MMEYFVFQSKTHLIVHILTEGMGIPTGCWLEWTLVSNQGRGTQDQTPFGKADGMPAVQRAKILILIEEIGSSITFKIKKNCKNILEQEYTIDLKKLSEYEKWINMKQRITPPPDVPEGKTFIEINCCR
eukprot:GHVL01020792.1.p1 GENE.GHVL01020792.1~~GHVL01020792.1.p1  ORF type:complete len:129 (+),score=24.74 GHVL01020792.1:151-537(+)